MQNSIHSRTGFPSTKNELMDWYDDVDDDDGDDDDNDDDDEYKWTVYN